MKFDVQIIKQLRAKYSQAELVDILEQKLEQFPSLGLARMINELFNEVEIKYLLK